MPKNPPAGLFPLAEPPGSCKATGEFRSPKRGELYLSGAIVQGWKALNNLTTPYWIAAPVILKKCPHCGGSGKVEA